MTPAAVAADAAYTEREAVRLALRFQIARAKHRERRLQQRLAHVQPGTSLFGVINAESIAYLAQQLRAQKELRAL